MSCSFPPSLRITKYFLKIATRNSFQCLDDSKAFLKKLLEIMGNYGSTREKKSELRLQNLKSQNHLKDFMIPALPIKIDLLLFFLSVTFCGPILASLLLKIFGEFIQNAEFSSSG